MRLTRMNRIVLATCVLAVAVTGWSVEEKKQVEKPAEKPERKAVYSGPQKGEKLVPFKVRGVDGEIAGKEVDFVTQAAGKPLFLVFVNGEKKSRPAIGLTRLMLAYAVDVGKDKIVSHLVWFEKDISRAESSLRRLHPHLGPKTSAGVSLDGGEGPGAYGLNRDVTLTVLVGKENTVTANFALVQPSDQDAPKILAEVAKLIGVAPPAQEDLAKYRTRRGMRDNHRIQGELREILAPDLSEDGVKKHAEHIEKLVGDKPRFKRQLGASLARLLNREGFDSYGTKAAREQLRALAKKYPPPHRGRATDKPRRPAPEKKPEKTDKTPDDKVR